jgi:hypothetical protein
MNHGSQNRKGLKRTSFVAFFLVSTVLSAAACSKKSNTAKEPASSITFKSDSLAQKVEKKIPPVSPQQKNQQSTAAVTVAIKEDSVRSLVAPLPAPNNVTSAPLLVQSYTNPTSGSQGDARPSAPPVGSNSVSLGFAAQAQTQLPPQVADLSRNQAETVLPNSNSNSPLLLAGRFNPSTISTTDLGNGDSAPPPSNLPSNPTERSMVPFNNNLRVELPTVQLQPLAKTSSSDTSSGDNDKDSSGKDGNGNKKGKSADEVSGDKGKGNPSGDGNGGQKGKGLGDEGTGGSGGNSGNGSGTKNSGGSSGGDPGKGSGGGSGGNSGGGGNSNQGTVNFNQGAHVANIQPGGGILGSVPADIPTFDAPIYYRLAFLGDGPLKDMDQVIFPANTVDILKKFPDALLGNYFQIDENHGEYRPMKSGHLRVIYFSKVPDGLKIAKFKEAHDLFSTLTFGIGKDAASWQDKGFSLNPQFWDVDFDVSSQTNITQNLKFDRIDVANKKGLFLILVYAAPTPMVDSDKARAVLPLQSNPCMKLAEKAPSADGSTQVSGKDEFECMLKDYEFARAIAFYDPPPPPSNLGATQAPDHVLRF